MYYCIIIFRHVAATPSIAPRNPIHELLWYIQGMGIGVVVLISDGKITIMNLPGISKWLIHGIEKVFKETILQILYLKCVMFLSFQEII